MGAVKMDVDSGLPICIGDDKKARESSRSFEGDVDEVAV